MEFKAVTHENKKEHDTEMNDSSLLTQEGCYSFLTSEAILKKLELFSVGIKEPVLKAYLKLLCNKPNFSSISMEMARLRLQLLQALVDQEQLIKRMECITAKDVFHANTNTPMTPGSSLITSTGGCSFGGLNAVGGGSILRAWEFLLCYRRALDTLSKHSKKFYLDIYRHKEEPFSFTSMSSPVYSMPTAAIQHIRNRLPYRGISSTFKIPCENDASSFLHAPSQPGYYDKSSCELDLSKLSANTAALQNIELKTEGSYNFSVGSNKKQWQSTLNKSHLSKIGTHPVSEIYDLIIPQKKRQRCLGDSMTLTVADMRDGSSISENNKDSIQLPAVVSVERNESTPIDSNSLQYPNASSDMDLCLTNQRKRIQVNKSKDFGIQNVNVEDSVSVKSTSIDVLVENGDNTTAISTSFSSSQDFNKKRSTTTRRRSKIGPPGS